MYKLPYFNEQNPQLVREFMENHPFVIMTGSFSNGQQVVTQVPVLLEMRDDKLYIQGHIMRKTDHHLAFAENPKVLIVFVGPQAYISFSWYTDQASGSTWNYMSVHASGDIRFMRDDEMVSFMRKLTLRFENNNPHSSALYDKLPEDYTRQMLPGIIGFEVMVEKLENVFKLSQNKDEASYTNIIKHLHTQGGDAALLAVEMEKRQAHIFQKDQEHQ